MKNAELRYRQIHLDFHTSEHCPNVGGKFDEDQFIGALKKGHVNSITIFAQCHHGWCYYPTNTDMEHPNLQTDLVGRMLSAAKKANINMPVYITVQWQEKAAREHPEWRVRRPDGNYVGRPTLHPYTPLPHGGWYRLCCNTPYLNASVLPVLTEVMDMYNPSGIRKGNIIHIAQPIFRVYDDQGMQLHRDLVKNCIDLLYDDPLLQVSLPSCGRVNVTRQPQEESANLASDVRQSHQTGRYTSNRRHYPTVRYCGLPESGPRHISRVSRTRK